MTWLRGRRWKCELGLEMNWEYLTAVPAVLVFLFMFGVLVYWVSHR